VRETVEADVAAGASSSDRRSATMWTGRLALLATYPEFRTLHSFRPRAGVVSARCRARGPVSGRADAHPACSEIGPGLFIQHGFATIVAPGASAGTAGSTSR
jgi:serine O-acetyltransferase